MAPITLSGLKRGEKGIYIIDATCTDEVKTAFKKQGSDLGRELSEQRLYFSADSIA